ncbi:unnamed protein product [Spodoptera littoralis]|uniref:Uncharacterized protein n=1 Tax=Spodoptera littoralis TaxID=7109 RepID=A0A9P0NA02_SPOLI|nr:unnamed protein product [Spodoptera littoralis]CAH1645232.1 unnamed protein product [Spodoptera littoralis]
MFKVFNRKSNGFTKRHRLQSCSVPVLVSDASIADLECHFQKHNTSFKKDQSNNTVFCTPRGSIQTPPCNVSKNSSCQASPRYCPLQESPQVCPWQESPRGCALQGSPRRCPSQEPSCPAERPPPCHKSIDSSRCYGEGHNQGLSKFAQPECPANKPQKKKKQEKVHCECGKEKVHCECDKEKVYCKCGKEKDDCKCTKEKVICKCGKEKVICKCGKEKGDCKCGKEKVICKCGKEKDDCKCTKEKVICKCGKEKVICKCDKEKDDCKCGKEKVICKCGKDKVYCECFEETVDCECVEEIYFNDEVKKSSCSSPKSCCTERSDSQRCKQSPSELFT